MFKGTIFLKPKKWVKFCQRNHLNVTERLRQDLWDENKPTFSICISMQAGVSLICGWALIAAKVWSSNCRLSYSYVSPECFACTAEHCKWRIIHRNNLQNQNAYIHLTLCVPIIGGRGVYGVSKVSKSRRVFKREKRWTYGDFANSEDCCIMAYHQ